MSQFPLPLMCIKTLNHAGDSTCAGFVVGWIDVVGKYVSFVAGWTDIIASYIGFIVGSLVGQEVG